MTEHELQKILTEESNFVDWKAGGDPEKIVKTLTAYANDYEEVGSGLIVCGVEELKDPDGRSTANVVGISEGASRKLRDRIFELSRSLVTPPIAPQFDFVRLDGERRVLVAWICSSGELHSFKGAVVVRLGDKVTNASVGQIAALAQKKGHLEWVAQPCPDATLDDIDFFALEEIAKNLPATGDVSAFLQPGFRMFGTTPPLTSRIEGPSGAIKAPNRFALLLVGKAPHQFLPGAFIALTRFPGLTRADAVFSSSEVIGPIPFLVKKVMGVLETEASIITDKTQDFLSGGQNRRRYSLQALQEILVNALAHRDYQNGLSTKISVFQDRIEFESPGGLPDGVSIDAMKQGRTRWRNPSLARFLSELGLAQERGTGIPKAIAETIAVAGVEPIFEASDWFKVTVPAYRPPSRKSPEARVSPEAGILLISIGHGTIEMALVRRSYAAFKDIANEKIRAYHHPGLVAAERWPELIREFRNWLRDCMEDPQFQEFHLFYRGPVAVGPLIGAMAVGRKPLVVHTFDEDMGLYQLAYRVDRRLLQEP
jgi:ATP-dependent DNA helicase RecG